LLPFQRINSSKKAEEPDKKIGLTGGACRLGTLAKIGLTMMAFVSNPSRGDSG
jgi:hypothetical protein